jgi:hypothetical protein
MPTMSAAMREKHTQTRNWTERMPPFCLGHWWRICFQFFGLLFVFCFCKRILLCIFSSMFVSIDGRIEPDIIFCILLSVASLFLSRPISCLCCLSVSALRWEIEVTCLRVIYFFFVVGRQDFILTFRHHAFTFLFFHCLHATCISVSPLPWLGG